MDRYFGIYMVPTLGKYKIRKPHRTGEPSHAGTGIDQVTVLAKVERGKTFSKPPSTHQSHGAKILEPPRHRPWVSWFLGFFQCKLSHASRRRIFYNNYGFDYLISNFLSFCFIKARLIYVKISALGICVLSKDREDQARNLVTDWRG